jgi:hypothetical protein
MKLRLGAPPDRVPRAKRRDTGPLHTPALRDLAARSANCIYLFFILHTSKYIQILYNFYRYKR